MTKVVLKKKNNIFLEKTKDIQLSIQFNLDGFSFCVLDSNTQKDIYFKEYSFNTVLNSPEDLLKKIESIFNKDLNLQKEYNLVSVIHQNDLSTLVPNLYFDEKKLDKYLNFNIRTLKTDFIAFDEIDGIDTKNIYIPYVNINNYFFQNFGEFEYKHYKTVLLEKLLKRESSNALKVYVNVSKSTFDIIILEHKKLLFCNTFSYETKEDFIYYILFTAEQSQLNTEELKLFFLGDIKIESELYKITYTYIKNIYFLESKNPIFKELEISNHSNYILLG